MNQRDPYYMIKKGLSIYYPISYLIIIENYNQILIKKMYINLLTLILYKLNIIIINKNFYYKVLVPFSAIK